MEIHQDREGNCYGRIRFGRQKAVNLKFYEGYWYYHMDDCYGTKITLGEDEFGDLKYLVANDFPAFKEEITKKQEESKKKKKGGKEDTELEKEKKKKRKRVVVIPSSSSSSCASESETESEVEKPLPKKKKKKTLGKQFIAGEAKEDNTN